MKVPEVWRIVRVRVLRLNEEIVQDDTILKGMRRNGMIAYRPDMEAGRLVRADSQAWCSGMPEGARRLKESWLARRYEWLQADHRPQAPDYRLCKQANTLNGMEEREFCAEEGEKVTLRSLPDQAFPANEGPDLGDAWRFEQEAVWVPVEDEEGKPFEASAAFLEREMPCVRQSGTRCPRPGRGCRGRLSA